VIGARAVDVMAVDHTRDDGAGKTVPPGVADTRALAATV
jgi:hypothetical protein